MRSLIPLLLALLSLCASAGGPVAPNGWTTPPEPTYAHGQNCCLPADLNGTGLIGGAFVLLSNDQSTFGIFALTYTQLPKGEREVWHLLEKHPIRAIADFTVRIQDTSAGSRLGIRVCRGQGQCHMYSMGKERSTFSKVTASRQ